MNSNKCKKRQKKIQGLPYLYYSKTGVISLIILVLLKLRFTARFKIKISTEDHKKA